jgi:pre-mRNA-processing factor 19
LHCAYVPYRVQNEWDEVMLETFTLKQHLDTTRQELAQALYQHDAACRVIARLMQERDEARQQLSGVQVQVGNGNGKQHTEQSSGEMVVDDAQNGNVGAEKESVGQLNNRVVDELVATCAELSAARKARKGSAGSAAPSKDAIKGLTVQASHSPHKADAKSAVACVAVQSSFPIAEVAPAAPTKSHGKRGKAAAAAAEEAEGAEAQGAVILSGGTDKNVLLTQQDSGRVLAKITGHHKKVTAVSFHGANSTHLFSASADTAVKVTNTTASFVVCLPGLTEIHVLLFLDVVSGQHHWHGRCRPLPGGVDLQGARTGGALPVPAPLG